MSHWVVEQGPDGVVVELDSGGIRRFSWRWLADHDQGAGGIDPQTMQRVVDTFSLPPDLTARRVTIEDDQLIVEWDPSYQLGVDGKSVIDGATLADGTSGQAITTWGRANAPRPEVCFDEVIVDDAAVANWLRLIEEYGFCVVTDVPPSTEATEQLITRIASPLLTIFGTTWQVEAGSGQHADSAYTAEALEPHTDGTYVENAPGLQLLHFTERAETGGASILVDGFAVADGIKQADPSAFATLISVSVPAHYIESGVELRADRPPFRLDRYGQLRQVSFNNYDRSPMWLPPQELEAFYHAYQLFHHHVNAPENQYELLVDSGQAVVFDNWRVLHGRTAFTGSRRFQGGYIGRDETDNRRRTLTKSS